MHGLSTLRALNAGRGTIKRDLTHDATEARSSYAKPRKPKKPKRRAPRWSAKQLGVKKAAA